MCGIVGYIGSKNAARILLNGLHRLEYRGYDSAGMALVNNGNLNIYKCAADTVCGQGVGKQIVAAAVNCFLCHDVPAILSQGLQGVADGCCTRCQS